MPEVVLKSGKPVVEIPRATVPDWVRHTVRIGALGPEIFRIPWRGGKARVIGLVPGQIVTESLAEEPTVRAGEAVADPTRDLAKIAVIERHLGTGRTGSASFAASACSAARSHRPSRTTRTTSSLSG